LNLAGEVTVGTVISGATLASLAGFIWRTAVWKTKQDVERKAEAAARAVIARIAEGKK
jgi:hypothetical protein